MSFYPTLFFHGAFPFDRIFPFRRVKFPKQVNPYLHHLIERMLDKDPEKRITIPEIRVHPWVTSGGTNALPSTDENCQLVEVTEQEVSEAVSLVRQISQRVKDFFVGPRKKKKAPGAEGDEAEAKLTPSSPPTLRSTSPATTLRSTSPHSALSSSSSSIAVSSSPSLQPDGRRVNDPHSN